MKIYGHFFDCINRGNLIYSSLINECWKIVSLNLSRVDTRKVTNMSSMFYECSGLTSLDLTPLTTTKVTEMSGMFGGCSGLTSLDLTSFDTTNVTDMSYMFDDCSSIWGMFDRCSSLTKLTVSSSFFNSTSLTSYNFSSLTAWTDTESLANFVSVLPTITTTKTLQLSSNTKSALTEDQISTITTTKGWTIA